MRQLLDEENLEAVSAVNNDDKNNNPDIFSPEFLGVPDDGTVVAPHITALLKKVLVDPKGRDPKTRMNINQFGEEISKVCKTIKNEYEKDKVKNIFL